MLTHCNAGGLATGGYGTAVGAIRAAWEAGRVEHVWVDETRPLLQGARLTAWELEQLGIPHAVIADSAAASVMAADKVDLVVTGADRIAANGDTANKIGTYGLAVLAAHHGLPLVIVAPTSTVDPRTSTGAGIVVEERDGAEVTTRFTAHNPAFDVTPAGADRCDRDRAWRPAGAVRLRREHVSILDQVDQATAELLTRFGFDDARFETLQARVAAGELSPETTVLRGAVEAPLADDLTVLPAPGTDAYDAAHASAESRRFAPARSPRSCCAVEWRPGSAGSSRVSSRSSTVARSST